MVSVSCRHYTWYVVTQTALIKSFHALPSTPFTATDSASNESHLCNYRERNWRAYRSQVLDVKDVYISRQPRIAKTVCIVCSIQTEHGTWRTVTGSWHWFNCNEHTSTLCSPFDGTCRVTLLIVYARSELRYWFYSHAQWRYSLYSHTQNGVTDCNASSEWRPWLYPNT